MDSLLHPPYSADRAPSNFHVFGAFKDAIRGKRFESDDEVIEEVKMWLEVQNSCWYKKGIGAPFFAGPRLLNLMVI
jgi:hypothetical protein